MWSIVIADWQVTFQGKFHFTLSWRMTVILVAVLMMLLQDLMWGRRFSFAAFSGANQFVFSSAKNKMITSC